MAKKVTIRYDYDRGVDSYDVFVDGVKMGWIRVGTNGVPTETPVLHRGYGVRKTTMRWLLAMVRGFESRTKFAQHLGATTLFVD